jgi:hypothetical protein
MQIFVTAPLTSTAHVGVVLHPIEMPETHLDLGEKPLAGRIKNSYIGGKRKPSSDPYVATHHVMRGMNVGASNVIPDGMAAFVSALPRVTRGHSEFRVGSEGYSLAAYNEFEDQWEIYPIAPDSNSLWDLLCATVSDMGPTILRICIEFFFFCQRVIARRRQCLHAEKTRSLH